MKETIAYSVILEAAKRSSSFRETAEALDISMGKLFNDLRVHGVKASEFKAMVWPIQNSTESASISTALTTRGDAAPSESDVLQDPLKLLNLLKDAILRKDGVDLPLLSRAVKQVLENYEFQNRLFLVAAANAELPRILKLLEAVDFCGNELFKQDRILFSSNRELIKMYALAQTHLTTSLDRIKQVADMRLDMMKASGGSSSELADLFTPSQKLEDAGVLIDARGRDKIRNIIEGVLETMDESPEEDDEIS